VVVELINTNTVTIIWGDAYPKMTRLVVLDSPVCNTTSPEILPPPTPWDVSADEALHEHAELWRKLAEVDLRGERTR